MVCDNAVRRQVLFALLASLAGKGLHHVQQRREQVGVVIATHALNDSDNALEAHAGIHMPLGERDELAGRKAVILDKYVIPNLGEAAAIAVDCADMPGFVLFLASLWA